MMKDVFLKCQFITLISFQKNDPGISPNLKQKDWVFKFYKEIYSFHEYSY